MPSGQDSRRCRSTCRAASSPTDALVHRVRTILPAELARVCPKSLIVEITEDVIVDDTVQEVIAEIRGLGVGLVVDELPARATRRCVSSARTAQTS